MFISFPRALLLAAILHVLAGSVFVFYVVPRPEKPVQFFFWGSILGSGELMPSGRSGTIRQVSPPPAFLVDGLKDVHVAWRRRLLPEKTMLMKEASPVKPDAQKFIGPRPFMQKDRSLNEMTDVPYDSVPDTFRPRMRYPLP